MSQRRLYFGGSFNPIHYGHLHCAKAVAGQAGFGHVIFVLSNLPPHKVRHTDIASASDRLTMCRIAVSDDPFCSVSDIEACRSGPSYTIDTVRALKAAGETEVCWLVGADMLSLLPKWHAAEDLIRECRLLIMARPGFQMDWLSLPATFRHLQNHVVEAPLLDISATEIRRRVHAGESIDALTPPGVARYIAEMGLYR